MPRQVIIMSGLPGCGKSTIAKEILSTAKMGCILSADDYHMRDGKYCFDPKKVGEAHSYCLKTYLDVLAEDTGDYKSIIIVDNTNTTSHEISPYYRIAECFGYEVSILRIHGDPLVCFKRTIHEVPLSTILSMHRNLLLDALPPYWKITHKVMEN